APRAARRTATDSRPVRHAGSAVPGAGRITARGAPQAVARGGRFACGSPGARTGAVRKSDRAGRAVLSGPMAPAERTAPGASGALVTDVPCSGRETRRTHSRRDHESGREPPRLAADAAPAAVGACAVRAVRGASTPE